MKAIITITAAPSYDALPNIQSINQPAVQPQSLQLQERRGERQASVNASAIIKLTCSLSSSLSLKIFNLEDSFKWHYI